MARSLSSAAAALGRKGGRVRGASKRRGGRAHYQALAAARWAGMSPEERSAEMSRRRRLGAESKD